MRSNNMKQNTLANLLNIAMNIIRNYINVVKESFDLLEPNSGLGSKDLDAILQNNEDRKLLDETIEDLKLKKYKSKKVQFSDRELEISIE